MFTLRKRLDPVLFRALGITIYDPIMIRDTMSRRDRRDLRKMGIIFGAPLQPIAGGCKRHILLPEAWEIVDHPKRGRFFRDKFKKNHGFVPVGLVRIDTETSPVAA